MHSLIHTVLLADHQAPTKATPSTSAKQEANPGSKVLTQSTYLFYTQVNQSTQSTTTLLSHLRSITDLHSLSQWDRKEVPVAGNGNCLFRAVSYLLYGHQNAHWSFRDLIIRFENLNSSIFECKMTGVNETTFAAHIRKLSHPNSWATHIEVLAIATYFQVPLYFCTDPPLPSTGSMYCWECYNPIASSKALRYPILTDPLFENANSCGGEVPS